MSCHRKGRPCVSKYGKSVSPVACCESLGSVKWKDDGRVTGTGERVLLLEDAETLLEKKDDGSR